MTRIIAGMAKGRRLAVPAVGTRPTSDRAREGLFNTLAASLDLDGAHVLDLFAGSGAVGLEALSRGAAVCVLVEADRAAATVARRNAAAVGLAGADVVATSVERFLAADPPATAPFDLVFADPPYATPAEELAAALAPLDDARWTAGGAAVVIERAARDAPLRWPGDRITPERERRYGEALLWYGRAR